MATRGSRGGKKRGGRTGGKRGGGGAGGGGGLRCYGCQQGAGHANDCALLDMGEVIDTHCHVEYVMQKKKAHTPNKMLEQCRQVAPNFHAAVSNFCDPASLSPSFGVWRDLLDRSEPPFIYGCFGIHPHNAKYYTDAVEERIRECLQHDRAVAWGECGLDYSQLRSSKEEQHAAFSRQIVAAVALGKPLVVHSRQAASDTLHILKEHMPREWRVHIHCFSDSSACAERLMEAFPNAFFGFTGMLTFAKSAQLQETVRSVIPLDRILLETDAPYMTPEGFSGICLPAMSIAVASKIADLKDVPLAVTVAQLRENARSMYGI